MIRLAAYSGTERFQYVDKRHVCAVTADDHPSGVNHNPRWHRSESESVVRFPAAITQHRERERIVLKKWDRVVHVSFATSDVNGNDGSCFANEGAAVIREGAVKHFHFWQLRMAVRTPTDPEREEQTFAAKSG